MRNYFCKKRIDESQEAHHQKDDTTLFLQSLNVEHVIGPLDSIHVCHIYYMINSSLCQGHTRTK
jgi:hypothetical protein